ncbi:hypothetical protein AX16_006766 [Volvariella volvacea WC 439]|nr:hypothetical protein AX16_006766 [Volvariella volvacea WC 439]
MDRIHLGLLRRYTTSNINVNHATFLYGSPKHAKGSDTRALDRLSPGKGKLSPTSSHLFKLILPLDQLTPRPSQPASTSSRDTPPTVFLLHPSQPLSHAGQLILASLLQSPSYRKLAGHLPPHERPTITFRNHSPSGQHLEWSESTDIADFIKDAARAAKFSITVQYPHSDKDTASNKDAQGPPGETEPTEVSLQVEVPTFADRTHYLRLRLEQLESQLASMEALKLTCDKEARRGVQRMAMGGFGFLVVYWGAVARLTFWDYGWDVMEPITYLSGLSTVIGGYLWFLYRGRELSYTSLLDHSISARRRVVYKAEGFDIDLWMEKTQEVKDIKREIGRIARDYEGSARESEDEEKEGKGREGGREGRY